MNYKEAESQIKAGDTVWVCDYRYNNIDEKPIRHVKPQKVMVVSNEELPINKKVYYSEIHFRPLGKNGQPKAQIIAPYDNTGFRAYTGVSLNIFFDEKECNEHYNKQCQSIIDEYERAKEERVKYYDWQIQQIRKEMI